ncbi:choice-of-anchor E domain-containing protein [Janthinobacterium lividum]|nr:choice-of-anchor E domain-containing protein [Janthinobacterium lividum]
MIQLGLNAIGSSTGSGSGNLLTQFQTAASGRVAVTYEYISAVPEPETYVMLLTGLALAGVMTRRRKSMV